MVLVGSNPTFEKMVPCLTNKDAYSNLLWTLFPPAREEYVSFEGRAIGDRAVKHLEKAHTAIKAFLITVNNCLLPEIGVCLVSTITILRRDFRVRVY